MRQGFSAARDSKSAVNIIKVLLHGSRTNIENCGYLLVGLPVGYMNQDLRLSSGEPYSL